eukprot:scaffold9279_cov159-Amphora_coffeaeformis.AAC.6
MAHKVRLSDIRIILMVCSAVFIGGISLQVSLFRRISQQHRNATAIHGHTKRTDLQHQPPSVATAPRPQQDLGRCAINLYGLPRAFGSLVLPSLLKNVIQREYQNKETAAMMCWTSNAAYQCDYFVHYYNLTREVSGRSGAGGLLDPHEVRKLTNAVRKYQADATVEYAMDEEEDFWNKYRPLLKRIHNTTDFKGRYLYYPWRAVTYKHPTVDNIVKMWHSIEQAWNTMEAHAQQENIKYTRVAMLRSDVVYMTPIDIWETEKMGVHDTGNNLAIIPGFGRYPVSDRIIYGPYKAVEQWSTSRFTSLDRHVKWVLKNAPGWGMHSEKFVYFTLLPNVRETGARVADHETMCFFRARSDETVWVTDCDGSPSVASPEIYKHLNKNRRQAVEEVIGRPCPGEIQKMTIHFSSLDCKSDSVTKKTR